MHARLPFATRRKTRPVDHGARLNGQIVLPRVLGCKVLGRQDICRPRVPDGDIGKGGFALHRHPGFAVVLHHNGCVHRDRRIDAVRLIDNAQRVGGLGEDSVVLRLVLVGAALQAGDSRSVDILFKCE